MLEGKNALVFGAGGHLGRIISARFEQKGATVFKSSHSAIPQISDLAVVDASDEDAVNAYIDQVAAEAESIDVVVNMVGIDLATYNHGKPADTVSVAQFLRPMAVDTASQFVTAKAAYRQMSKQGSGVIIMNKSTLAKVGAPWCPALSASHAATKGLMRSLAHEYGPAGVRSEAMPESPTIAYTFQTIGANMGIGFDEMKDFIEQNKTALKELPQAKDTAAVYAFAASDLSAFMAGTMLNNSAGHIVD